MATGAAAEERASNRAAWALSIASAALIAQHVAGRSTRDALFLTHFDVGALPAAMIAAAAVSSVAVLVVSRLLSRLSPARVVPASFVVAALLFGGEWALARTNERAAALVVYGHTAIFGAAAGSAFWSVVNERFDPHTAKRVVGRIAGGGTLGGIVGGLMAWRASAHISIPTMLALLAGLNLIGAVATSSARRGERASSTKSTGDAESGLKVIADMPYLRDLALLVFVGATAQALLDYLLSARAPGKGPQLLGFFALYHLGVSVVTFVAQAGLVRPSLERRGLAGTLRLHPVTVAGAAALALALPGLGSTVVLRGAEAVARNSLYRSAFELLYTPLPAAKKRASKTIVDVGVDRIGTALGSGAILLLSLFAARALPVVLIALVLALMVASYVICGRLHHGYVRALAFSLKSGAVELPESAVEDLDTKRTLAETTALLDRTKLLEKIGELQRAKRERSALGQSGPRPLPDIAPALVEPAPIIAERAPGTDEVVERIAALRSGDPRRVRPALAKPLPPSVAAHAVALLDDDALVRDAVRALRKVAPRVTGMLVDILLDTDGDATPKVRRRIPRILKVCRTQRAADGLIKALDDASFDVRVQAALALCQIVEEAEVRVDAEAIFAIVLREVTERRPTWADARGEALDADRSLLRGLAHVFVILGVVVEREAVSVALRALRSDDAPLRGTAYEFLEVVLPESVRTALLPLLENVPRSPTPTADAPKLAATLARSHLTASQGGSR